MSYSFTQLVGAELYRTRRQRSNWALPIIPLSGLAVVAMLTITSYGLTDLHGKSLLGAARNLTDTAALVVAMSMGIPILLIAARVAAHDYAYGTVRLMLGGGAGRITVLLAKLATSSIVGLMAWLIGSALAAACVLLLSTGVREHLTVLPGIYWREAAIDVGAIAVSLTCCVVLGTATSTVSRSLVVGVTAAMVWFPAENILTGLFAFVVATTHQDFFIKASGWLLAPNLNHLIQALEPWRSAIEIGARPLGETARSPVGPVGAEECLIVIAAWIAIFLGASLLSVVARVDVLE
jgi:ABC-type transport system involved in multi-copper enzyme maturation permease subunit